MLSAAVSRPYSPQMLPNNLEPVEVCVIGSLIEKELSTPDHYAQLATFRKQFE